MADQKRFDLLWLCSALTQVGFYHIPPYKGKISTDMQKLHFNFKVLGSQKSGSKNCGYFWVFDTILALVQKKQCNIWIKDKTKASLKPITFRWTKYEPNVFTYTSKYKKTTELLLYLGLVYAIKQFHALGDGTWW